MTFYKDNSIDVAVKVSRICLNFFAKPEGNLQFNRNPQSFWTSKTKAYSTYDCKTAMFATFEPDFDNTRDVSRNRLLV